MRIVMEQAGFEYRTASERKCRTPEDAARAAAKMAGSATECFAVLCLDAKNGMRASEIVTAGLVDSCQVHAREVFRTALAHTAVAVVLVHNHPSGDATPSAEDLHITKRLVECGRILGVRVLDHVVVGVGQTGLAWVSMRENGLVDFSEVER